MVRNSTTDLMYNAVGIEQKKDTLEEIRDTKRWNTLLKLSL